MNTLYNRTHAACVKDAEEEGGGVRDEVGYSDAPASQTIGGREQTTKKMDSYFFLLI